MMSPQTSLPKGRFFKAERPSGAISVAKVSGVNASCRLAPNAAVVQTIVTAVVQVVHDFKATGCRQSDQRLFLGFCRQVSG